MLGFGLFGCGRIGRMHADTIGRNERAALKCVFDVYQPAADEVAARHGSATAATPE